MEVKRKTDDYLAHHGIKGQRWGVRRWQNADGSLTPAGRKHYGHYGSKVVNKIEKTKKDYDISYEDAAKTIVKDEVRNNIKNQGKTIATGAVIGAATAATIAAVVTGGASIPYSAAVGAFGGVWSGALASTVTTMSKSIKLSEIADNYEVADITAEIKSKSSSK